MSFEEVPDCTGPPPVRLAVGLFPGLVRPAHCPSHPPPTGLTIVYSNNCGWCREALPAFRQIERERPDVVHVHDATHNTPAIAALRHQLGWSHAPFLLLSDGVRADACLEYAAGNRSVERLRALVSTCFDAGY